MKRQLQRSPAVPTEIGKTRTTCVATMLRGGHASNALPQTATATVSCRIFPGTSVDEVKAKLQELVGSKVEVRALGNMPPADASPLRRDVLAAVTKAAHARYPGLPVVPAHGAGATDGAIFRGAGIPTYGVSGSLIKASDAFSHGLNERLPVESFYGEPDALVRAAEGACRQALGQLPMGRMAAAPVSRFAGTCPSTMALPRYRKSVESTS